MPLLSDISVIIVNYRGWEKLAECLDALMLCGGEGERPEVIVVDNHSDDGRLEDFVRRYPQVKFLENAENAGFARGNNRGAAVAGGKYFLFLNPDAIISRPVLESLLAEDARHERMHLLSVRHTGPRGREESTVRIFPSAWTVNSLVRLFYLALSGKQGRMRCRGGKVVHPEWVSGSLVMMRRETFRRLKGWDEDYWLYYEDVDLCRRLHDQGGEILLLCEPPVIHHHGGTTRQDKKRVPFFKTYVLISRHIYYSKHFHGVGGVLLQLFLVTDNLFFGQFFPALLGLLLLPFHRFRRHLIIYIYLIRYYSRALLLRRWHIDPGELPFGKE